MSIITWIILGGLAGWVASIIMGKDAKMGLLANIFVGIIGSFIGGWVVQLLGGDGDVSGFNLASFGTSLLGAVILLGLIGLISGKK